MNNASDIEIIYLAIAVAGLAYSVMNLYDRIGDWRFLRERKLNGERSILARDGTRKEAVRVVRFLIKFSIAIAAARTPPPVVPAVSAFGQFVIYALMALAFMSLVNAALDRHGQAALIREAVE